MGQILADLLRRINVQKVCNLVFYWIVTGSWWKPSGADIGWSAEKIICTKRVFLYLLDGDRFMVEDKWGICWPVC